MLVVMKKSSAEQEVVYKLETILPFIADSQPLRRSMIGKKLQSTDHCKVPASYMYKSVQCVLLLSSKIGRLTAFHLHLKRTTQRALGSVRH